MAQLKFKVIVTDPPNIIEHRIKKIIADKINLDVKSAINKALVQVPKIIRNSLYNSPEVQSLLDGDLKAELGVINAKPVIEYIIDKLIDSFVVQYKPFSSFDTIMKGKVEFYMLPSQAIQDIISSGSASYLTQKGVKIPWLEWLLTLGDKIIVRKYTVDFINTKGSRTGLATMKPNKRRGWRVPPQFSGTEHNNFITRAMDEAANDIGNFLRLEIIYP